MHWTGTQWSASGLILELNIGVIALDDTVTRSYVITAMARPGIGDKVVDIKCRWHEVGPTSFPIIVSAGYEDIDTGEFRLTMYNQNPVITDFTIRNLYVELTPPYALAVAT